MKFSTFFLVFLFGLVAFAQAAPGDAKPAPAKGKPKPKPKPKHHSSVVTMAPSMTSTFLPNSKDVALGEQSDSAAVQSSTPVTSSGVNGIQRAESMGVVAVLCGVAVACVVAIVAVMRAPTHRHMPLADSSENMA